MNRPMPETQSTPSTYPTATPARSLLKTLAAAAVLGAALFAAKPASAGEKPWQLNLSMAPTKGAISLGRDFGLRYVGVGLNGIAYSSRDGFEFGPAINFQRRYEDPRMPYLGLTATANYSLTNGGTWETPYLIPAVGKEIRYKHMYFHAELYASTPMILGKFGDDWDPGVGIGIGLPF